MESVKYNYIKLLSLSQVGFLFQIVDSGGDQTLLFGDGGERLRWFLLPCEAEDYLHGDIPTSCADFNMPFFPGRSTNNFDKTEVANELKVHYCSCSPVFLNIIERNGFQPKENVDVEKSDIKEGTSSTNEKGFEAEVIVKDDADDKRVSQSVELNQCNLIADGEANTNTKVEKELNEDKEHEMVQLVEDVKKKETVLTFHNPPKIVFAPSIEVYIFFLKELSV